MAGAFRFAFKVTDTITIKRFQALPKYGENRGQLNENFLNAPLFVERFLGPLGTIRSLVGPIMFEFSKFHSSEFASAAEFIADLDRFFSALPKGWLFGVELRNRKPDKSKNRAVWHLGGEVVFGCQKKYLVPVAEAEVKHQARNL